jgi:hypothetical protein
MAVCIFMFAAFVEYCWGQHGIIVTIREAAAEAEAARVDHTCDARSNDFLARPVHLLLHHSRCTTVCSSVMASHMILETMINTNRQTHRSHAVVLLYFQKLRPWALGCSTPESLPCLPRVRCDLETRRVALPVKRPLCSDMLLYT